MFIVHTIHLCLSVLTGFVSTIQSLALSLSVPNPSMWVAGRKHILELNLLHMQKSSYTVGF